VTEDVPPAVSGAVPPAWEVPATVPDHPVWEVPPAAAAGQDAPGSASGGGSHPEIGVGLAFVGGLATAIILKRLGS
jgi:hypothetical protein